MTVWRLQNRNYYKVDGSVEVVEKMLNNFLSLSEKQVIASYKKRGDEVLKVIVKSGYAYISCRDISCIVETFDGSLEIHMNSGTIFTVSDNHD